MKKTILFLTVLLCLSAGTFAQQDAHYSQYMFNTLLINPAYAGSREHASLTSIYRNQWTGFDGAPVTGTFSAHMPSRNLRHGFGTALITDKAGAVRSSSLNLMYAYRIPMGQKASLALGLQATLENYAVNYSKLRLEDASDLAFGRQNANLILPNAGTGAWFQTEKFYAGISAPRLIRSDLSAVATSADTRRERHFFFTSGLVIPLNESIKMRPSVLVKATPRAPVSADMNLAFLLKDKLWLGASYRTQDAIVFMAEWNISSALRIGYAYDLTTSSLNSVQNGSHEIMLGYDFTFTGEKIFSPRYF